MMFVRLSVRLSVCLSGMGVHCDHTVHFSADLSLCLDSPMFYGTLFTYTHSRLFPVPPERGGRVWMYKLGVIYQGPLKIEVKLLEC